MEEQEGKVLWFDKTYGFIKPDLGDEEIFFHWTNLVTNDDYSIAYPGDRVTFFAEIIYMGTVQRTKAINVKITKRINREGKKILRLAMMDISPNLQLSQLHAYITSKHKFGIKYVNFTSKHVLATDISLSKDELDELELALEEGIDKFRYTVSFM